MSPDPAPGWWGWSRAHGSDVPYTFWDCHNILIPHPGPQHPPATPKPHIQEGCQEEGPDPLLLGEDSPRLGCPSWWMPLALQALLLVVFLEESSLSDPTQIVGWGHGGG